MADNPPGRTLFGPKPVRGMEPSSLLRTEPLQKANIANNYPSKISVKANNCLSRPSLSSSSPPPTCTGLPVHRCHLPARRPLARACQSIRQGVVLLVCLPVRTYADPPIHLPIHVDADQPARSLYCPSARPHVIPPSCSQANRSPARASSHVRSPVPPARPSDCQPVRRDLPANLSIRPSAGLPTSLIRPAARHLGHQLASSLNW